jgi:hypothetical protein
VIYLRDQIRLAMFKKVPSGYVFRAPKPWLFGAASHYLVSEAQKAELVEILTPLRPHQRPAVLVIGPTLGLLLLVVAINGAMGPFFLADPMLGIALWSVLIVATLALALHIENRPMQRRLQPVLAGLERTDERITNRELRAATENATSVKQSLSAGAGLTIFGLILANTLLRSHDHEDGLYYLLVLGLVFVGVLAAGAFAQAIRKARQEQQPK